MTHRLSRPGRNSYLLAAVTSALLSSCGSDSTGPVTLFSIRIPQPPAATTLGTSVSFPVQLSPTGFTGTLALTASGAPASWSVRIIPSRLDIFVGDTTTQTATVTISIPSNGDAAPSGRQIVITGSAPTAEHSASTSLTVANEYVLPIASGVGATGQHWSAALGGVLSLKSGVQLTIRNDDAIAHQVYTSNAIPGFPPQPNKMDPGGTYSNLLGVGEDTIYCELHGPTTGKLAVKVQ